jgi:hypothetical protein
MNNIDIDELYEIKRNKELEIEEVFFVWYYGIPRGFASQTNYKIGDKYVIELSNIDKKCDIKLEIDRKMYDIVDEFVTSRGTDTIDMWDIMEYYRQELDRKENK